MTYALQIIALVLGGTVFAVPSVRRGTALDRYSKASETSPGSPSKLCAEDCALKRPIDTPEVENGLARPVKYNTLTEYECRTVYDIIISHLFASLLFRVKLESNEIRTRTRLDERSPSHEEVPKLSPVGYYTLIVRGSSRSPRARFRSAADDCIGALTSLAVCVSIDYSP
ncbi:hypothetical protein EVAR_61758_1 [Eumeta japonica]|uniref:Uncharacterized protein n=1 Tax=Eumeta variegata TaxID=151549 RepID=A0A4C1Z9N6_EUMVA|nr:hypothetical protein EVAR_61758_1 [Eumeta japonica]